MSPIDDLVALCIEKMYKRRRGETLLTLKRLSRRFCCVGFSLRPFWPFCMYYLLRVLSKSLFISSLEKTMFIEETCFRYKTLFYFHNNVIKSLVITFATSSLLSYCLLSDDANFNMI